MYHVTEEGEKPWQTGPEIQIQDNQAGHDPQKAGWLYQLYSTETDATKPAGEWNQLRIVITPEKCEHFMNGKKYVEYVKGSGDWNEKVAAASFRNFRPLGNRCQATFACKTTIIWLPSAISRSVRLPSQDS